MFCGPLPLQDANLICFLTKLDILDEFKLEMFLVLPFWCKMVPYSPNIFKTFIGVKGHSFSRTWNMSIVFLCWGVKPPPQKKEVFRYDTNLHLIVRFQFWSCVEDPFIAITSRFTLTWSDGTCSDPIYGSNRYICELFVLDRNTSYMFMGKNLMNYTRM